MTKITLFSQIINKLNKNEFKSVANKYNGDKYNKGIDSWTHLTTMLFLHLSKANSNREVCNGLQSASGNLRHLHIQKAPCKSSLSYINAHRDWQIFSDYYYKLYESFGKTMHNARYKFKIKNKKILLLDSTLISLCLSMFDWARYRKAKGAIKLHTLLDYETSLPIFINFSDGKLSDTKAMQTMPIPSNSVIVADRAYIDFETLYRWNCQSNNFVIRLKKNVKFKRLEERELPDGRNENILVDEYIELEEEGTKNKYPKKLRRVVVYDAKNDTVIELITNNFTWTAGTIAELYKQRWSIELFFKEIKQNLKIKTFIGTSQNAVQIQIWTALISILILKYLKHIAKYTWHMSNLVFFLRLNLFVKIDLQAWLDKPHEPPEPVEQELTLFN